MPVRTVVERGPKGKRAVAFALDWPGWSRGAKTPESEEFAKRLGLRVPEGAALTPGGLRAHRETYVATMRAYNAGEGKRMRSWNLPFLIRHSAFHVLDHAWEMEDKDLSAAVGR